MADLLFCRECSEGKHGNCDGTAWSNELDAPAPCTCPDPSHAKAEPTAEFDAGRAARLRAIAEAATPGIWDAVVLGSEGYEVRAPNLDSPIRRLRIARCGYEKWEIDRANAEHIAAFSPSIVLGLLDEIDALRASGTSPAHVGDYLDGDGFTYCQECTEATGDYVLVTDCPSRVTSPGAGS